MRVIKEFPPNIEDIRKIADIAGKAVVFTYGDIIYNPSGEEIPRNLEKHEEVHMAQQGDRIKEWWERYINDPKFRLDQEVEAYRVQYKYVAEHGASRDTKREFLRHIAQDLSGPIYGRIINFEQAKQLIIQSNE